VDVRLADDVRSFGYIDWIGSVLLRAE
jgi:hypothetical protein